MEWSMDTYKISDDYSKIDFDKVYELITNSYWGQTRSREIVAETLENSLCFGVYYGEKQIGVGRVVTDGAVFSWICDIIIDINYRGKGLGKWLVQCILEHPKVKGTIQYLVTKDAQGLYERYGFKNFEGMRRVGKR